jgi:endonuclease/exonuclease/phosphatase family metal-dependent hydrolase
VWFERPQTETTEMYSRLSPRDLSTLASGSNQGANHDERYPDPEVGGSGDGISNLFLDSSVLPFPANENKKKLLFASFLITTLLVLVLTALIVFTKRTQSSNVKTKEGIYLRILSFNVWYGGNQINLQDTAEIIKDYGADIIGLQEIDANLLELSKLTGLPYVDERRFILSRYPIFNSGAGYRTEKGSGTYSINGLDSDSVHAWILVAPGKIIAFANTHLTSDPYGPDEVAAGKSSEEVMEIEIATRGPDYTALAEALEPIARGNTPLFLTGDFNAPSHLDWTEETVKLRPHMHYAFDWPSSRAMTDIGLRDTYREVYPNPVTHPGITFTPGMPSPQVPKNQNLDRIDFLYASGDVEVLDSEVIDIRKHCLQKSNVISHQGVEVSVSSIGTCTYPYPSDHSAVLSSVIVQPIDSPWLVNIKKRRVIRNEDDLEVSISIPLEHSWSVAIVPANGKPKNSTIVGMFNEPMIYRRSVRFGSNPFEVGEYDAVLLNASSKVPYDEVDRVRFTIIDKETILELSSSTDIISISSDIPSLVIEWKYAPGDRDDFIAVYSLSTVDVNDYLGLVYTGARFSGSIVFNITDCNIPFEIGSYKALFMSNDQFVELGRVTFEVVE